jgi:glucose-6-phosphate isomerase
MSSIQVNIKNINAFVESSTIKSFEQAVNNCHEAVLKRTGAGNEFLGWATLPWDLDQTLLEDIKATADKISKIAEVFVVIGIGGSYLGARAVIEALKHNFDHLFSSERRKKPLVLYAGHHLSEDYLADLLEVLDERDYAINVISKSGTTTEPAIAFRILKNHLEKKYGIDGARERIIATTDKSKGALSKLSGNLGYKTYIVPDDVGGRYSVLTPVGLLPIAVAGFDIEELVNGARSMQKSLFASANPDENPAALYAVARNALYSHGRFIEIMVNYLPSLGYLAEWWKQLYGESEGKEGKGIFPAAVNNTTDLHSMGQYIQEGERKLFETVINVEQTGKELRIPPDDENLDQLNYIAGKTIDHVNKMAEKGTTLAHIDGGVPCIEISIPRVNEFHLGELIFFFEFGCALSGYLLEINPFDQPGVEAYKKNMFALLNKPGHEKESEILKKRLGW